MKGNKIKIGWVMRKYTKYGSSRYAVEIINYIAKKGNEIHVFCNEHDSIKQKNIVFHKIPVFTNNFIIQELCFFIFATIIVNLYCLFQKFSVVYSQPGRFLSPDVAGVHYPSAAWSSAGFVHKFLYSIEKHNLGKAKKIIAVSNVVKSNIIEKYNIPEKNIEVIHNGININEFSLKNKKYRKGIRQKIGLGNNDIVLLFVGNPFSRKGLEYAIRALPLIKNKNTKLLVLGNDNIRPYLDLAKKLKNQNSIIYAGYSKEINKFFAASDIFVFPTLYEPFGLVILEAMASGLPVVVSKQAGAAELIDYGKEGLLLKNPKNPKEIAEKINLLIKNKKLRNRISKQARKTVEKHTWNKVAKKWLDILKG